MSEQNDVDERELYPDSTRFDSHAPGSWTVREVKNPRHVIFEYDGNCSPMVHVEGDGISPIVSFHGRSLTAVSGAIPFIEELDGSFEAGLKMAEEVMQVFHAGVVAGGTDTDTEGAETTTFEAVNGDHAVEVPVPEARTNMSFGDDDQDIVAVMEEMDRDAHERGQHEDRTVDGCPECAKLEGDTDE